MKKYKRKSILYKGNIQRLYSFLNKAKVPPRVEYLFISGAVMPDKRKNNGM